jgi:hypothetical protein
LQVEERNAAQLSVRQPAAADDDDTQRPAQRMRLENLAAAAAPAGVRTEPATSSLTAPRPPGAAAAAAVETSPEAPPSSAVRGCTISVSHVTHDLAVAMDWQAHGTSALPTVGLSVLFFIVMLSFNPHLQEQANEGHKEKKRYKHNEQQSLESEQAAVSPASSSRGPAEHDRSIASVSIFQVHSSDKLDDASNCCTMPKQTQ